jgi:hypothetical protein
MTKKAEESKFAQESSQLPVVAGAEKYQPSAAMLEIFKKPDDMDSELTVLLETARRLNLPEMLLPSQIPMGVIVTGEIIKFIPSPKTSIKGRMIWLKNKGIEFLIPAPGGIRSALAPGLKDEDEKLDDVLETHVGRTLILKKTGVRPSKYKNNMFLFEVFIAPTPVV